MTPYNLDISQLGYRWMGIYSPNISYQERDVVFKDGGAMVIRGGSPQAFALGQQDAIIQGHLLTGGLSVGGVAGQVLYSNADGSVGFRFTRDRNGTVAVGLGQSMNKGGARMYATSYCMHAIMADGSVRAWGRNDSGELGIGGLVTRQTSGRVPFPPGTPPIKSIAYILGHCYAVDAGGGLWSWGANHGGWLSGITGLTGVSSFPRLVNGNSGATGIPANAVIKSITTSQYDQYGYAMAIAIDDQGRCYFIGYNGSYAGGLNNTSSPPEARLIPFTTSTPIKEAFCFGGNYNASALLDFEGRIWVAGNSEASGAGTYSPQIHKRLDLGGRRVKKMCYSESDDHAVAASQYYRTLALLFEDGDLYLRGDAGVQTRGGFTHSFSSPWSGTPELTNVEDCYFINGSYEKGVCLMKDGTVRWKGYNGYWSNFTDTNQISTWTTVGNTPGMLQGVTKLRMMGAEFAYACFALRGDGKLVLWGRLNRGAYGNGVVADGAMVTNHLALEKPIIDFSASGFVYGTAVPNIAIHALTSDGQVYSWGSGDYGMNGNQLSLDSGVPEQIRF
jgi:alpha-tubulin suppressor-like RCC1 family protein